MSALQTNARRARTKLSACHGAGSELQTLRQGWNKTWARGELLRAYRGEIGRDAGTGYGELAIAVHALAQCRLMKGEPLVLLSHLGKASPGTMGHGNGLLNKAWLLPPAELANKNGADRLREAPYGSHRSCLAAKAARLFSQPIMAARLVLIRSLYNPKPATSSIL